MEKESSEMSLDEVLSSIKKMVIDEEPPVLELTEMVSDDGSIVSLKKDAASPSPSSDKKNTDMSAFLKLIQQEGAQNSPASPSAEVGRASASRRQSSIVDNDSDNSETTKTSASSGRKNSESQSGNKSADYHDTVFQDLVIDTAKPLIEDWIRNNLEQIVRATVQSEVRSFLNKKRK